MKEARTLEELRALYEEELARKDDTIRRLREENDVLMRMSLRGAEEKQALAQRVRALGKQQEEED